MSLAAAAYYQNRANRLDIGLIPEILEGDPVLLLGNNPGDRLSLHEPNQAVLHSVAERYTETTRPAAQFALRAYGVQHPHLPVATSLPKQQRNMFNNHYKKLFTQLLFPAYLKAGRISDIQIEALARDEVDDSMIKAATTNTGYLSRPKSEDSEVYFLTTAALHAGRHLGYTSCLTIIGGDFTNTSNNPEKYPGMTIKFARFMSIADKRNDLLAKSGLAQSRAIRNVIDSYGLQSQIVQPVRRGKSDKGSRPR